MYGSSKASPANAQDPHFHVHGRSSSHSATKAAPREISVAHMKQSPTSPSSAKPPALSPPPKAEVRTTTTKAREKSAAEGTSSHQHASPVSPTASRTLASASKTAAPPSSVSHTTKAQTLPATAKPQSRTAEAPKMTHGESKALDVEVKKPCLQGNTMSNTNSKSKTSATEPTSAASTLSGKRTPPCSSSSENKQLEGKRSRKPGLKLQLNSSTPLNDSNGATDDKTSPANKLDLGRRSYKLTLPKWLSGATKQPQTPPGPFTISQVLPFLYIGGLGGLNQIKKLKIKAVLTVCEENVRLDDDVRHMSIAILDEAESSLKPRFDAATDFIEYNRRAGRKALVHCLAGISRSATIVLAYLMRFQKMDLRSSYRLLVSKRSIVRPNIGFFKQLADYELELRGTASVKLVSPYPSYPKYTIYDVLLSESQINGMSAASTSKQS